MSQTTKIQHDTESKHCTLTLRRNLPFVSTYICAQHFGMGLHNTLYQFPDLKRKERQGQSSSKWKTGLLLCTSSTTYQQDTGGAFKLSNRKAPLCRYRWKQPIKLDAPVYLSSFPTALMLFLFFLFLLSQLWGIPSDFMGSRLYTAGSPVAHKMDVTNASSMRGCRRVATIVRHIVGY